MQKPSSPRQEFIEYLVLRPQAPRTVQSYADWIVQLSRFHHRPPADLGNPEIPSWLLEPNVQRKLSASSINPAINALRSFNTGHLDRHRGLALSLASPTNTNIAPDSSRTPRPHRTQRRGPTKDSSC